MGSHKPNIAVAQAYSNRQAGISRIATETGAGWVTSCGKLEPPHLLMGMHEESALFQANGLTNS